MASGIPPLSKDISVYKSGPIPASVPDKEPKPIRSAEAVELARKIRAENIAREPALTNIVVGLANKIGGVMYGLDNRLKTTESLARKIDTDVVEDKSLNGSRAAAAAAVSDATRYTIGLSGSDYTNKLPIIIKELEANGYKCRVKNFWQDGDPYQGINIKVEKDGVKSELQIHTPESMSVKEVTHKDYEVVRETSDAATKKALWDKMVNMAGKIPHPAHYANLLGIGVLSFQKLHV